MNDETSIPVDGCAHVDRGRRLDQQVQKAQAKRREEMAKRPVENASANSLPNQNR